MLCYLRCFSLKHILRPVVIDGNVVAESIRNDIFLVPVEGGGGETPLNIHRRNWLLLGTHLSVMVLILVYVRSKWSRV